MTKKELAKAIVGMSYGELRSVATDLAAMVEDKDVRPPPTTPEQFMDMLFDWAESETQD